MNEETVDIQHSSQIGKTNAEMYNEYFGDEERSEAEEAKKSESVVEESVDEQKTKGEHSGKPKVLIKTMSNILSNQIKTTSYRHQKKDLRMLKRNDSLTIKEINRLQHRYAEFNMMDKN